MADRLYRIIWGQGSNYQCTKDFYAKAHTLKRIRQYFGTNFFTVKQLVERMDLPRMTIYERLERMVGLWLRKKKKYRDIDGNPLPRSINVYALNSRAINYRKKYGSFENREAPIMKIARRKLREHLRRMG